MPADAEKVSGLCAFRVMLFTRRDMIASGREHQWPAIQRRMLAANYDQMLMIADAATGGKFCWQRASMLAMIKKNSANAA